MFELFVYRKWLLTYKKGMALLEHPLFSYAAILENTSSTISAYISLKFL
jgi:hypothetical protein